MDDDSNHEIRRHLLLGRKVMINLDSVLKSRGFTLLTKVHIVFPEVTYGCESWTAKKAKHQSTAKKAKHSLNRCLQTVVLEKAPESPLESKEIGPVNLKGNQP